MACVTENTKIQARLWHLDVERPTRNFINAKRRSLHRSLAEIPKILLCLIPEDIDSKKMVKFSANYIKEAERNYSYRNCLCSSVKISPKVIRLKEERQIPDECHEKLLGIQKYSLKNIPAQKCSVSSMLSSRLIIPSSINFLHQLKKQIRKLSHFPEDI